MRSIRNVAFAVLGVVLAGGAGSFGAVAQEIPYRKTITLKVGETAVIHGARGECGKPAPEWSQVIRKLPPVALGSFSDGGLGERKSRSCGGPTPARAIRFTATKAGAEQILVEQDPITITVTE